MKRVISNTGSFFLVDNENRKRKSRRARKREGNVKEWKSASRRQGIIIDSPGKANAGYGITLVMLLLRAGGRRRAARHAFEGGENRRALSLPVCVCKKSSSVSQDADIMGREEEAEMKPQLRRE